MYVYLLVNFNQKNKFYFAISRNCLYKFQKTVYNPNINSLRPYKRLIGQTMSIIEIRFAGRYKIEELITRSKLKHIYRARNLQTGQLACIKAEFFKSKSNTLLYEGKFYQMTQGCVGIPMMFWCGPESQECNCLIMQYLGYPIQQLIQICGGKFSLKTTLMLSEQLLQIIEVYHFKELIHRNLCPRTLQMGKGAKNHLLFLNDLLSSKRYVDSKTGEHLPKRSIVVPQIFNYFNSINVMNGTEPSRRDDMESWLLITIYFLKGTLPWLGIQEENNIETLELILEKRKNIGWKQLCEGLPKQFLMMANHISKLQFQQRPDYDYLRKRLRRLVQREEITTDYIYDWLSHKVAEDQKMQNANVNESPLNCEVMAHQESFLRVFYEPYAKDLELNEVQKKYKSKKLIQYEQQVSMRNNSEMYHPAFKSQIFGSNPEMVGPSGRRINQVAPHPPSGPASLTRNKDCRIF